MWCLADGREIQDISIRTMWLRFQRSIGLRRPWSWRHQVSSTVHETPLQWQSFPCQESRFVLADGLHYPLWVLLYDNRKRGTLITVCAAEWNQNVQGQDYLVVVCLPYCCPENGSCHVIQSICAIDLQPSELKKALPFRGYVNVKHRILYVSLSAFSLHSYSYAGPPHSFLYWARKLLKTSLKSGVINKHVTEIKSLRTNSVETNSSRIFSPKLLSP